MKRLIICFQVLMLAVQVHPQDGIIAFKKDTVAHTTKQYKLSENYTEIVKVELDTLIGKFHRYKRIEDVTPFYQTLGNYGLPYLEMDFTERIFDPEYFLYRHLRHYMHHAGNKKYIDTQVPFTELRWTFGGERRLSEQTLGVRHSQNVNPFFNIGLDLNIIYNLGQYNYQKADNRSFTLHSSYLGKKYRAFASWSINNMKAYENGGVADPGSLSEFDTRDVPVNLGGLNEAQSTVKNMNFQVVQKYTIGGSREEAADSLQAPVSKGLSGTFSHILEYEKGHRLYTDNDPDVGFYDSIYISSSATNDSLYARILRNTLRFDFNTSEEARFQLGIGVGVLNELNVYAQVIPSEAEETDRDTLRWTGSSNAIKGNIYSRIGDKFNWQASGKLYFTGLRAGDFEAKGQLTTGFNQGEKRSVIKARGGVYNNGPARWMNNYGSNHFKWSNDFNSEFRVNIGGDFKYPGIKFNVGIDYTLISNFLYFNDLALPDQHDGSVSVLGALVSKDFSFWKMRFDNTVLVQKSSNENVLTLPLVSARTAFYFNHEFHFKSTGGRLQTQLGFELEYNTSYYSRAYMPATGIFYKQREIRTGNYPLVNVFANIKLKRTRIFVAFDHVTHGLIGYDYFVSPYYPMNVRMFKYGIAWTFYN